MLKSGDRFGDYTVERLLGRGGMGSVFLLENAEGGQVAAKILDPATAGDHEARRRFVREAQLALGVEHPNLVQTYDVGEDPETGLCYILMEYVPGGSLADRIKKGPFAVNDAIRIVYQIASVLELARQKGVVHRDIKPGNIMFGADGKAKLADLGIARGGLAGTETTTVTQTGMMIGTPAYMAPEQMLDAHHVDSRADIYSLGIVFYEMLTGERPNKDDTVVQLMAKAVAGEPIPDVRKLRPEVSASVAELISLMCAMKADERISTPYEVTTAISQIVHGREVTIVRKRPSVVPKQAEKPGDDSVRKVVAIALGLVAAAGVAAFAYFGSRGSSPVGQALPRPVARTNVVERSVEVNRVVTNGLFDGNAKLTKTGGNVIPARQSTYRLRKVSELEPRVQKQLKEMASKRKSGASRGIMVFGRLRIDGVCSGRHVASYAWLNDDGFFTADVWPKGNGSKGRQVGGQLNFLKHGYCPLDLDLVKESDRKWSDAHVLDLGYIEMEKLSQDQSRTLSFEVNLPQGVDEAELVLSLRSEKPSGYDWSVQSRLQRASVNILRRRVAAGATVEIGDCTSADYALLLKARGCASYKKQIDVTDATMRNMKSIFLPRAKVAKFAIRPFVGGAWKTTSVLVDNEQSLRFHDEQSRHRLLLDPFEEAKGIVVSSYYNPSSFDDYGELTTSLLDDQIAKGAVAQPFQLGSGNSRVRFFPGRIYRFRNSYLPIDALIAFLDYREVPLDDIRSAAAHTTGFAEAAKGTSPSVLPEQMESQPVLDPSKFADEDSTRRVQKALDALFPGWRVRDVKSAQADDAEWQSGFVSTWRGLRNVVATHPPSGERPTVLSRTVWLTQRHPVLLVETASQSKDADFMLSVKIDGRMAFGPRVVCTPDERPNDRIVVPLEKWRGKQVKIEIEHACNGWFYEHAFWSKLEIAEGSGKEVAGPVGVVCTEVFPRANPSSPRWKKRAPWLYVTEAPEVGWKDCGFDDRKWKRTVKALGDGRPPEHMSVAQSWQSDRIWIRRKFNWNGLTDIYKVELDLYYDQDVEIFLNGREVARRDGWNTDWVPQCIDSHAFAGALRRGENVLAATLKGNSGGSYFDCGLSIETPDGGAETAISVRPTVDPKKLYHDDTTKAVQKALNSLFPGWKTSANRARNRGTSSVVGYVADYRGKSDLICTLPPSGQDPVLISRRMRLPAGHPALRLSVCKNMTYQADFFLRVLVNGQKVHEERVNDGKWHEPVVDLSQWAGKDVKIEIQHCGISGNDWGRAYWAKIEVR